MTPEDHRTMNTGMIIIVVLATALIGVMLIMTRHTMHDCEERLYEKLTNHKFPTTIIIKEEVIEDELQIN